MGAHLVQVRSTSVLLRVTVVLASRHPHARFEVGAVHMPLLSVEQVYMRHSGIT